MTQRWALWLVVCLPLWADPFAGSAACLRCHRSVGLTGQAPMDRALYHAADVPRLHDPVGLSATLERYRYRIASGALTVSDATQAITAPIRWAFGTGKAGQTYILEFEHRLYESRVSFYQSTGALDLTLGAANQAPGTLREALGRAMSPVDVQECFGCHASQPSASVGKLDLAQLTPGITCERCHGPGARHSSAQQPGSVPVDKLQQATTEETFEFCGQCHRTWAQVASLRIRGVNNVRFQPYRLTKSACYDPVDRRVSCTACHSPHQPVETRAARYDSKCTACHAGDGKKVCRVSKQDCVTCHMPKYELPGTHHEFTDHWIRVARAGAPYPD